VKAVDFACHPEGAKAIDAATAEQNLDGAVLAACSCCDLDQVCDSCTTQRTRCKEQLGVWRGSGHVPISFANVREQCAFVHADAPRAATAKAGDMIAAAAAILVGFGAADRTIDPRHGGFENRAPITALIDPVRCRGCEDCEIACGLDAIHVSSTNGKKLASVDSTLCLGCSVCVAACSSGAISGGDLIDSQIDAALAAMDINGKTVVFACNWGAYSAVEAASVERLAYSPSVRIIRVMCAGRVHEGLLLKAFSRGAERVLLLACGSQDDTSACHYRTGADQSLDAVLRTRKLLRLLGFDSTRLGWADIRPGDGKGFVAAIQSFAAAAKHSAPGRS
jgi:coenzyme F420-reducing hydrogenase delta subunit/NAD-dependent dihydropyrimidine dehydrogenase PreA subunit